MSNKHKLLRELRKTLDVKQDVPNYISGILGAVISGEELVAVPGRNGFVYVRMRNSESEFIQAFNESVNNVYGLPVLLEYDKHYYVVVGKDTNRYSQWGSGYGGAQLAAHGDQHSFGEGSNTGTDIVWVYKRQFMPLLVKPSNPFSMSVAVEDDWYQWNNELKHYTGTSIDMTGARPGDGYSRFVTLYVDATTNTVKGVTGSNFNSSNYGASVESYIPTVSQTIGIPVGSVRVDGTGTDLRWSNLYDIRSLWTGPSATLVISDDSVIKVTGTAIDFGAGLDVSTTGSVAYVKLNYSGTFTGLTDTPNSYVGQQYKYVRVNSTETGLEFASGTSGGGGDYPPTWKWDADEPDAPLDAMDDDFDDGSLDAKWTVYNPTSSGTYSEVNNHLVAAIATTGANETQKLAFLQNVPSAPWTVEAKVTHHGVYANYAMGGMLLYDSGSGRAIEHCLIWFNGFSIYTRRMTTRQSFSADLASTSIQTVSFYLQVSQDVSNNLSFSISPDRVSWRSIYSEPTSSWLVSGTSSVGLFLGAYSQNSFFAFDWFRRTA